MIDSDFMIRKEMGLAIANTNCSLKARNFPYALSWHYNLGKRTLHAVENQV